VTTTDHVPTTWEPTGMSIHERLAMQVQYVHEIEFYNLPEDAEELDIARSHLHALEEMAAELDNKRISVIKELIADIESDYPTSPFTDPKLNKTMIIYLHGYLIGGNQ
jgi:hypothetical protein